MKNQMIKIVTKLKKEIPLNLEISSRLIFMEIFCLHPKNIKLYQKQLKKAKN